MGSKTYHFYGWENANCRAVTDEYKGINTPIDLYEALSDIWCADTCAPRMRHEWTKENMTLGQCSITAFFAQDIFGGEVRGILLPGGNYHCFNVIGDCQFDLTSEQFGDEKLDYTCYEIQTREVHFAKQEKYNRYQYLKKRLAEREKERTEMEFKTEGNRIFTTNEEGKVIAEITFPENEEGICVINHTFVDECLRGQGIAGKLVGMAAAQIKDQGKQIGATCSYAKSWLEKHQIN